MALADLGQDTREVGSPDQRGRVEFRKTHSSSSGPLSLKDYSIRPYSDDSGGRATFSPVISTATEQTTNDAGDDVIHVDFSIRTQSAQPGSDHLISYEIEDDDNNISEFQFFFQNGIWDAKENSQLLSRLSSEFERLSRTFQDGDFVLGVTDFTDFDTWDVEESDLEFVSESSTFGKHTDEQVPHYNAGNSETVLRAPGSLFDSRDGTIFVALQWDQQFLDEPILEVKQGNNAHMRIRNTSNDFVVVESDFADPILYGQETYANEIFLAEVKINTSDSEVFGAANREMDRPRQDLNSTPIEVEDLELVLNPNDLDIDLKLFEFLAFPEAKDFRFSNKVASMFSYLYNVDMTESAHVERTTHIGSPDISNHLFYDERTDLLDPLVGFSGSGTPRLRKLNPDDASEVWNFATDGEVLDVVPDNLGFIFFADAGSDGVTKLSKSGEKIWEFPISDDDVTINSELQAITLTSDDVAVGAYGTDVYGIDEAGQQAWKFGGETEEISDVAATNSGRTYVGKVTPDPDVILLDSEGEEVSRFTDHLNDVSSVVADSNGLAYSGAINGEIRFSNESGNQFEKLVDVHETEIRDLDVDSDYLYTASADGKAKKIEIDTVNEVWALDFTDETFIETNIDAIDSNDMAKPDPGTVSLSPLSVTVNPAGEVYVVIEDSNDEIDNHIFKVDSSKSVLWVEVFLEASTVSVQPGPEASQWT